MLETSISVIIGVISLPLAIVASIILFELNSDEETAMSRFQLNKDESIMDFKLFFFANLLMSVSFLFFWFGSVAKIKILIFGTKYLISLYGVFLTLLFARWVRRF